MDGNRGLSRLRHNDGDHASARGRPRAGFVFREPDGMLAALRVVRHMRENREPASAKQAFVFCGIEAAVVERFTTV